MTTQPVHKHPVCDHWVGIGEDGDAVCCICESNPCPSVTVELMVRHRDFDIELWSRPVTVGGGDEPPF